VKAVKPTLVRPKTTIYPGSARFVYYGLFTRCPRIAAIDRTDRSLRRSHRENRHAIVAAIGRATDLAFIQCPICAVCLM